jgi:hypothetical protein
MCVCSVPCEVRGHKNRDGSLAARKCARKEGEKNSATGGNKSSDKRQRSHVSGTTTKERKRET